VCSHVLHSAAPGLLNLPSGQPSQVVVSEFKKVPPEQMVHETEPLAVLNCPSGHDAQEVDPTVDVKLFTEHFVHAERPAVEANVPATQAAHVV
jgi:hypothetical protein